MGLPDVIYECHEAVTSYRLIPNPEAALGGGYKYGAALQWKDDGSDWRDSFHIGPEAMEALGHALLGADRPTPTGPRCPEARRDVMIGGKLIHIDHGPETKLWIVDGYDELCVHVTPDDQTRLPEMGETVWWQSGQVYFGGPDMKHGQLALSKIGYSHKPHACRSGKGDTP